MKNIVLPLLLLFITSFSCHASQPEAKLHEEVTSDTKKRATTIAINIFESSIPKAELIGDVEYMIDEKKKIAELTRLHVYPKYRNKGYGTTLLKTTLARMSAHNPKHIIWEAQWLDQYRDMKNLLKLVQFYQMHGAIIIKNHIPRGEYFFEMEYQPALGLVAESLWPMLKTGKQIEISSNESYKCITPHPLALICEYAWKKRPRMK